MPTARVADSYGGNPHEHKPSQDPFDPDEADDKQAETGGIECPGTNSSDSQSNDESSETKNENSGSKPVRTMESPSRQGRMGNSTARSTGTDRKVR